MVVPFITAEGGPHCTCQKHVILAGEPGTGKTAICKAIIAEADDITCIITNAYGLGADDYITELYELAQDLSPCIVFIEDIDLIGQDRTSFGYYKGSALLSLLAVLDGVEIQEKVVTIATTNCLETLDRAIRARPSRFDRVIHLSKPSLKQRLKIVSILSEKIPFDEPTQEYIARKAEGCTPAQLQEVVHSLVIEYSEKLSGEYPQYLNICSEDIDKVISKVNTGKPFIGFNLRSGHE